MKAITCDKCKGSIEEYCSYLHVEHAFGYGTKHDGERFEVDLCDKCIYELFQDYI